jgi:hypothetical protein
MASTRSPYSPRQGKVTPSSRCAVFHGGPSDQTEGGTRSAPISSFSSGAPRHKLKTRTTQCHTDVIAPSILDQAERGTRSTPISSFSLRAARHKLKTRTTQRHTDVIAPCKPSQTERGTRSTPNGPFSLREPHYKLKTRTAPCTPCHAEAIAPYTPTHTDSRMPRRIQWTPSVEEMPIRCQSDERGFFFPFSLPGDSRESSPSCSERSTSSQSHQPGHLRNNIGGQEESDFRVAAIVNTVEVSSQSSTSIEGIADAALEKTADLLRMLSALEVEQKDDCDGSSTTCPESRSAASLSGDAASEDEDSPFLSGMWSLVATLEQNISSLEERFTSLHKPGTGCDSTGVRVRSKSRSHASMHGAVKCSITPPPNDSAHW